MRLVIEEFNAKLGAMLTVSSLGEDGSVTLSPAKESSPVAKGHNPLLLTEEQVGTADGWRLLEEDEIFNRFSTREIQSYDRVVGWSSEGRAGNSLENAYRTKMPAGHFRSKERCYVDGILKDLKQLDRDVAFGHPNETIEQLISKYKKLL